MTTDPEGNDMWLHLGLNMFRIQISLYLSSKQHKPAREQFGFLDRTRGRGPSVWVVGIS